MKVLGSLFFSFIMTIIIFVISLFMCVRVFLSPMIMTKVIDLMIEEEGGFTEELLEDFPVLGNYLDEDKMNKELGIFFSDYIKYLLRVPNQDVPTLEGIKEVLDEAIDEYVKDTGEEFDYDSYNEEYEDIEKSIVTELVPESERVPEEVGFIMEIIYSDVIMVVLALIIIFSILIDYLIRKDFIINYRHVGIVSLINSFIYGSVWLFLLTINTDGDVTSKTLLKIFAEVPLIITLICGVVGVLLIVLPLVFRKKINNNNGLGYYCPPTNNINNGMYN